MGGPLTGDSEGAGFRPRPCARSVRSVPPVPLPCSGGAWGHMTRGEPGGEPGGRARSEPGEAVLGASPEVVLGASLEAGRVVSVEAGLGAGWGGAWGRLATVP